jgi:uridine kinase
VTTLNLADAVTLVERTRRRVPAPRAALIAISGIDGSGKGCIADRLRRKLEGRGYRVAPIGVDGWLNLPRVRFGEPPAEHYYKHALRFDQMFAQLVLPLRDRRSVRVEVDFAEETATEFRKQLCVYDDVDIILLEGIYLLKREHAGFYDAAIWIDCPFETALQRATARGQEGLAPEQTIAAYQSIYFPAQELHFRLDDPIRAATAIVRNA